MREDFSKGIYKTFDDFTDLKLVKDAVNNRLDILLGYDRYHASYIQEIEGETSIYPGDEGYYNFLLKNVVDELDDDLFLDSQGELNQKMKQIAIGMDRLNQLPRDNFVEMYTHQAFSKAVSQGLNSELDVIPSFHYFFAETMKRKVWSEENLKKDISERQTDFMTGMMGLGVQASIEHKEIEIDQVMAEAEKRGEDGLDLSLGSYSYLLAFFANKRTYPPAIEDAAKYLTELKSNSLEKFGPDDKLND